QESIVPPTLIRAGDFEAARKHFVEAAEIYEKAWQKDRTHSAALFLQGWALTQAGKEAEGKQKMELAHLLPLGNPIARYDLLETLVRHKLTVEARRERELLIRVTPPPIWQHAEAVRES